MNVNLPCPCRLAHRKPQLQTQCHISSQTPFQKHRPPSAVTSARLHPSLPEQPPNPSRPVSASSHSSSSSSSEIPGKQALPQAAPSQQPSPKANSHLLCLGRHGCPQKCLPQAHHRPRRRPKAARHQKPPTQAAALRPHPGPPRRARGSQGLQLHAQQPTRIPCAPGRPARRSSKAACVRAPHLPAGPKIPKPGREQGSQLGPVPKEQVRGRMHRQMPPASSALP